MADTRAATYLDDDIRVWRASSFGNCEQFFARLAMGQTPLPPPETMLKAMDTSAGYELDILAELGQRGYRQLTGEECEQYGTFDSERSNQLETELRVPGGIIRCHPDAIVQATNDAIDTPERHLVVEVKALRSPASGFLKLLYDWQFSIEMASTGLKGLFVTASKDEDGGLVYEGDRMKLDIAYTERAPYSRGQIMARAARLNQVMKTAEEGGGLPNCDVKMWPCGFYPEHDKSEGSIWHDTRVELDGEVIDEARVWAEVYASQAEIEKEAKTRKKEAGDKLKIVLAEAGLNAGDRATGGGFNFTMVESRSTKYDAKAAEADGVDLEKYKVSTPYTFVKVEPRG